MTMNPTGLIHLGSAIYLAMLVALVISVNDGVEPRRIAAETLRRSAKLLGGLLIIGLTVMGLGWLG